MTLVVYPFRYKDARTGRWVKARYKADRTEIAVRYAEWEIIGPGEERRPRTGYNDAWCSGGIDLMFAGGDVLEAERERVAALGLRV